MKLYVCYGFLKNHAGGPRPDGHPCGAALKALRDAGHDPEVTPVGGMAGVPVLSGTKGRKEVKALTGQDKVPVLVTDDGTAVFDSKKIVEWAQAHRAAAAA